VHNFFQDFRETRQFGDRAVISK